MNLCEALLELIYLQDNENENLLGVISVELKYPLYLRGGVLYFDDIANKKPRSLNCFNREILESKTFKICELEIYRTEKGEKS